MTSRRPRLHAALLLLLSAGVWLFGLSSCSRDAESPTDTTTSPQQSLQLLATYSLSVTEPSGLAYSPATQTLYMISDNRAAIFAIDSTGKVLSTIPVVASDIEGVAVAPTGDTLYIVEESASRVTTVLMNGTIIDSMSVLVRTDPKHSLEGITIGPDRRRVVINEKAPTMLLEFAGKTEVRRLTLTYSTDISDICYDAGGDSYWIVSDESQKVMKLSRSGALLGEWTDTAQQGEGIAIIGDRIYIVSDVEAKLFVYKRPAS